MYEKNVPKQREMAKEIAKLRLKYSIKSNVKNNSKVKAISPPNPKIAYLFMNFLKLEIILTKYQKNKSFNIFSLTNTK